MLNILFMAGNYQEIVCLDMFYHLEQAISKIANCRWAGPKYKTYRYKESVEDSVRRVMPNADWVIYFNFETLLHASLLRINQNKNRRYKVAAYVADLHRNPQHNIRRFNHYGWDVVLMSYTLVPYTTGKMGVKIDPFIYRKNLQIPYFHMSPSVNPQVFKPLDGEKKWDIAFLGAIHEGHYPLRRKIWAQLPDLAIKEGWKTLIRKSPPGQSFFRRKPDLLQKGYIVGEKYAEAVARSKIFIFGTSKYKYPLLKFSEAMACKTCVLADIPLGSEEVGFIADWNFVAINEENWGEKLKYYITHDKEREIIAQRGYETFLKYHTSDIRARQIVDFLEELVF